MQRSAPDCYPVSKSTCMSGLHEDGEICILGEDSFSDCNLDPKPLKEVMKAIFREAEAKTTSKATTRILIPDQIRVGCNGEVRSITWRKNTQKVFRCDQIVDPRTATFVYICHELWCNTESRSREFSRSVGRSTINYHDGQVICRKSILDGFKKFQEAPKEDLSAIIDSLATEWFVIDQNHGIKEDRECINMTHQHIRRRLPDGYESDCTEPTLPRGGDETVTKVNPRRRRPKSKIPGYRVQKAKKT